MKRMVLPLMVGLLTLCGCAHNYVMKLSNGTQITTASKPKLKGGNFHYKDASGRDNVIPQSRVMELEPISMAQEDKKFQPVAPKKKQWYWPF
jgi:hypothetical protein